MLKWAQQQAHNEGGGRPPLRFHIKLWISAIEHTLSLSYLSPPALRPGSGDERRVAAHHGRVLHEHAVRERLVRGELDHLEPEPRPQDLDVRLMLPLRLGQVHLRRGAPERLRGQGRRDSPDDGVGVMTKACH